MKTLMLGLALLIALSGYSQTSVRTSSETVGFWTLHPDTMLIKKYDKVIKGSVYVPSYATDSVKITGCTFTVNGIATNGVTIAPGEAVFNFGFDYALSDSIRIMARDIAWVMLMIKRD